MKKKKPYNHLILWGLTFLILVLRGEGEIRTRGTHKEYNSFRDCPVRPLRHLSNGAQN